MAKRIAEIPLETVERVQIYINAGRKTMAAIKAETGADYLLNGGLYNMARWRAVCNLKADGYVYAEDLYRYRGYAWDTGPDIKMALVPETGKLNYICCVALIWEGEALALSYPSELGGTRQRSAMGLKDGKLCLYCNDGAVSPAGLRTELLDRGWDSAVMLDGGGSSQCDFDGQRITSTRVVHNLILVYTRKGGKEDKPMDGITVKYMTANDCYKAGRTIVPKGIMVHSTAAPGVMAAALRAQWNKPGVEKAVHAMVDDTGVIQTLPWNCRGWHAGVGPSGTSANNTHISFEICEPDMCRLLPIEWVPLYRGNRQNPAWAVKRLQQELQARGYDPKGVDGSFGPGCEAALQACQMGLNLAVDGFCGPATLAALAARPDSFLAYRPQEVGIYFLAAYGHAVALCATLCKRYGFDPMKDILCHSEGYEAGIASNHADVMHWFPEHGVSMDDFRAAVKALMEQHTAPDYRAQVKERFCLDDATLDYLEAYKYSADLLRKLATTGK